MSTRRSAPKKNVALQELEETVEKMRALGVLSWNGIVLGPAPVTPEKLTEKEVREREQERLLKLEERRRDKLYGASRIRPFLVPQEKP